MPASIAVNNRVKKLFKWKESGNVGKTSQQQNEKTGEDTRMVVTMEKVSAVLQPL
jgi:hypothetical protein